MDLATNVLIFISLGAIGTYVLAYGTRAPWWRSHAGRTLFALGVVLFAISTLAAAGVVFGQNYELRPIARLLTWGATANVGVGLLVAWIRAQRRSDGSEKRNGDPSER